MVNRERILAGQTVSAQMPGTEMSISVDSVLILTHHVSEVRKAIEARLSRRSIGPCQ
jgi:hypothetical protein